MNNLTNPNYLKSFLKQSGLKPKHYLGQNFLVDEDVLQEIIATAQLKKSDTVLEVGPGLGVLTQELVKHAGKVIAVEKDERMVELLRQELPPTPSLIKEGVEKPPDKRGSYILVNQDILKFHLDKHIFGPYKVVANIPYYLTSHLIKYFLEQKNKPQLMVLVVQKEVGERVVAQPGELSVLGISVQFFADAEIAAVVPKESFWPIPKVDSAILRIEPKEKYPEVTDHKLFFRIIKTAFAGKRKQIHNTLANLHLSKEKVFEILTEAKINPSDRPQELGLQEWVRLCKLIADSLELIEK